jgi:predicted molibdopterin-dependent oxidoreductase YjgC
VQHAICPPAGKQNWEIISALATSLGYPMHYPEVSDIYREIVGLVPLYKTAEDNKTAKGLTQWSLSRNRKFRFGDGFARLKPLALSKSMKSQKL